MLKYYSCNNNFGSDYVTQRWTIGHLTLQTQKMMRIREKSCSEIHTSCPDNSNCSMQLYFSALHGHSLIVIINSVNCKIYRLSEG